MVAEAKRIFNLAQSAVAYAVFEDGTCMRMIGEKDKIIGKVRAISDAGFRFTLRTGYDTDGTTFDPEGAA